MINTIISEKPVKSRIFEDFEGIKNAPPRLLLRVSPRFDSRRGCQKNCQTAVLFFVKIIKKSAADLKPRRALIIF